jgi:phenylacetate-CoA ligase
MGSDFFDTSLSHFDDPEVRRHSELSQAGDRPETVERQGVALDRWKRERHGLKERFFWDRSRLEAWVLRRLSLIVDHAYENTDFYRRIYRQAGFRPGDIRSYEDFHRLPTVRRDDLIREFPHGIVARGVDPEACRWIRSSGSSGKPVQMVVEQRRADLDTFFKYRQFELMGGFDLLPDRWIYNIHHSLWWYTSFLGHYPVFTLGQECRPESVLRHIERLRPLVVSSLASALPGLAGLGESLAAHGVGLVATNSETSSPEERARWERVFGVPVRDEYSSEELDIIAHHCRYGEYHLVEDDCYVESLEPDGNGVGHAVGTDLWNQAMPIIRYQQGDLIRIDEGVVCPCGSGTRVLGELHGRADQAFISEQKGLIAPGNLMELCDLYLAPAASGAAEFRLVQSGLRDVELIYVPHGEALRLTRAGRIPPESGYKRRTILCKVRRP